MSTKPSVLIVGAGLIGCSIGLAAREAGYDVSIRDMSDSQTAITSELTGLKPFSSGFVPDIVVIAVPPAAIALEVADAIRMFPQCTVIDTGSIKTQVVNEVESIMAQTDQFIPSHPMAGKESSGAANASFDLFNDRIWVMCPSEQSSQERIEIVKQFIEDCGAIVVEMSSQDHDQIVAVTSHTPQILSSLLAAQLLNVSPEHVRVSGQGLRDMTRIASSEPKLWTDILLTNAAFVAPIMQSLSLQLQTLADDLKSNDGEAINSAILLGNQGRALVPGKHGERSKPYATVAIVIQDAPGQLAAIFAVAGAANVNIEDVRIDHALGRAVAVIELDVDPLLQESLREALIREGWTLRSPAVS